MRRPALVCVTLLISILVVGVPALAQDDSFPFPVQEFPLPALPAYDITVAPGGDIGALYVGTQAMIVLGMDYADYQASPLLLPIRLVDLTTGEELRRFAGGTDYIMDVAFSSTGDRLASYHRNGEVKLWDVASGDLIRTLDAIPVGASGMTFMPDDTTLMIHANLGYSPAMFLMMDTESGAITRIVREHFDSYGELGLSDSVGLANVQITAWSLSPDGLLLATSTQNGEVKLWDMDTLAQTVVLPLPEEFRPGNFNVRALQFSADGRTLIYYNRADEQTHFWDVATETETAALPLGDRTFAVSPDIGRLAWASRTDVWLADVDDPDSAQQILVFADYLLGISSLAFTPDGSRLIVGGFGTGDENDGTADNLLYIIDLE